MSIVADDNQKVGLKNDLNPMMSNSLHSARINGVNACNTIQGGASPNKETVTTDNTAADSEANTLTFDNFKAEMYEMR